MLNVLADGSPSPTPGYGPAKFSSPVNGTVQFNGNGYQYYKIIMSFFENGTNIPINVDVFQQILDIDGDGDFNNDFSVDDIRAHGLPSLVNQVMDDYIKINTADFDNFETSTNSFVYTKQASGVTSFYSSGTDNPNVGGYGVSYSGISGFLSPAIGSETQAVVVAYKSANTLSYIYYGGQFTGIVTNLKAVGYFPSIALPLNWLSVNGVLNTQSKAVINWKVSENNVMKYEIEKSTGGNSFESIATITSKGDGENQYSYMDKQVLRGTGLYRIKQTDFDGRFTYSTVMKLYSDENTTLTVYPTKFTQSFTVVTPTAQSAALVNMQGQVVKSIKLESGSNYVPVGEISTGVYVLKTADGKSQKIIKSN